MAVADASGLPVSACLAGASPHEVKLAEKAPDSLFISGRPDKLIGGKACDSGSPDAELMKKHGVEMTAPHPDSARNSGRTEAEAA